METNLPTKRRYKMFDHHDAVKHAKRLIKKAQKKQHNLVSIRIDPDTIVQINAERPNMEQIVERIKNRRRVIPLVEQLEYGQYA